MPGLVFVFGICREHTNKKLTDAFVKYELKIKEISQARILPSNELLASLLTPIDSNETTLFPCPIISLIHLPLVTSQMRIVSSSEPLANTLVISLLCSVKRVQHCHFLKGFFLLSKRCQMCMLSDQCQGLRILN